MKRRICILVTAVVIVSGVLLFHVYDSSETAVEQSHGYQTHDFVFRDFIWTETVPDECSVEFVSEEDEEFYRLLNPDGTETGKLSIIYVSDSGSDMKTVSIRRDRLIEEDGRKPVNLSFSATVQYLMTDTSKHFVSVQGTDLTSDSTVCSSGYDAWSHTGEFPCTQLDYSYTVNLPYTKKGFFHSSDQYSIVNGNGILTLN